MSGPSPKRDDRINISLPKELMVELKRMAKVDDRSVSNMAAVLIRRAVKMSEKKP